MSIILETRRLILREFTLADAADLFAMDSLPIVHRYLGNKPIQSMLEAEQIIENILQKYSEYNIGRWVAIEKQSMQFVGWSGLNLVTQAKNNHINYYDLGYRLHPDFWGKGYASESAKAALDYGFENLLLSEVFGTCHEENIASRKALEKCGLKFIEKFLYNNEIMCDWLHISRLDWEQTIK